MNIKINFDKYEVKDTTKNNVVKVLMLKGEKGDVGQAAWGDIIGTITNQTDLINLIEAHLLNYYTKSETYTKTEVNNLVSTIPEFSIEVVQTLPTTDISPTTIYLTPSTNPKTQNTYDEFIYINNTWEQIGSTTADFTNYYTKSETDTLLNAKADASDLNSKQDALVSGTNIKTVNGNSLLGSGDVNFQDNLVNVGSSVDSNYKTNIIFNNVNLGEFEQGAIGHGAGTSFNDLKVSSNTRIRTKNLVQLDSTKTYKVSFNSTYNIVYQVFDNDNLNIEFAGSDTWYTNTFYISGVSRACFAVKNNDNTSNITPSELSQIQLSVVSDISIKAFNNGKYETIYSNKWELLGQTTANNTISLPNDFEELFVLIKTNNSDFRKLTFIIPKIALTNTEQYFNTGWVGANTSTYNGARISLSITSANLDSAYNDGNDVRSNTTTYWYYK